MTFRLDQDMHIHSTFSDGRNSVAENLAAASALGLTEVTCVDHVRADTRWLPDFVAEVRACAAVHSMKVNVGIEAKFADSFGTLDMPEDISGVDYVFGADHRMPYGDTSLVPRDVKKLLANGTLTPQGAIDLLTSTTIAAMRRHPKMVVAHLFSFLPKIGINKDEVPEENLQHLAEVAIETGATIEIDERWRCPSFQAVELFAAAGVRLCASTDSHKANDVGRYDYVAEVAARLRHERGFQWAAAS